MPQWGAAPWPHSTAQGSPILRWCRRKEQCGHTYTPGGAPSQTRQTPEEGEEREEGGRLGELFKGKKLEKYVNGSRRKGGEEGGGKGILRKCFKGKEKTEY